MPGESNDFDLRKMWMKYELQEKNLRARVCVCVCVCVRERERERERHTHTREHKKEEIVLLCDDMVRI
jgi:hypothetical protein